MKKWGFMIEDTDKKAKLYTKAELLKGMTDKQRKFCEEYVVHWNATKAAKNAGYSPKTAKDIGCQNLAKVYIKRYIDWCKENTAQLAGISALRNAQELAKIAYGNLSDLRKDWLTLEEWEKVTDDQKAMISEIEHYTKELKTSDGEAPIIENRVKIKLHDKKGAIAMLNKMFDYDASSGRVVDVEADEGNVKVTINI